MVVRTQTPADRERRGVIEGSYISDPPLDCLTCGSATMIANAGIRPAAGRAARRRFRIWGREPLLGAVTRYLQSLFRFRSIQMHRIFSAACTPPDEVPGPCAADHRRSAASPRPCRGSAGRELSAAKYVHAARACRHARAATLTEKQVRANRPARRTRQSSPPAPIAGSGSAFRAEMRGRQLVASMVPWKDGKANQRAWARRGPFAGYARHQVPHPRADDPRGNRPPWREAIGIEAIGLCRVDSTASATDYRPRHG